MTDNTTVVLTRHQRKDLLGHGGMSAIARDLGVDQSIVSRVVNGKQRNARIEEEIARRIGVRLDVAFPPLPPGFRSRVAA